MIRKLSRHGNSQALVIDKTLCELLGIDMDTPLKLEVEDGALIVRPAYKGLGPDLVKEAMERVRAEYGDVLKDLAKGPQ